MRGRTVMERFLSNICPQILVILASSRKTMLRVIVHSSKPPLLPAAKWIHFGNSESSAK
jgi:hypothetical protein